MPLPLTPAAGAPFTKNADATTPLTGLLKVTCACVRLPTVAPAAGVVEIIVGGMLSISV